MWIARDKDGHLVLFTKDKPIRSLNDWQDQNSSATWVYIDECYAPTLTWEDEPIEVDVFSMKNVEKTIDYINENATYWHPRKQKEVGMFNKGPLIEMMKGN